MKTLAHKRTGNYDVTLVDDGREYALLVVYYGTHGSDNVAKIWLEPDDRDAGAGEMRAWFREHVRGDMNVTTLLTHAGFDQYTNLRGRSRGVAARL